MTKNNEYQKTHQAKLKAAGEGYRKLKMFDEDYQDIKAYAERKYHIRKELKRQAALLRGGS